MCVQGFGGSPLPQAVPPEVLPARGGVGGGLHVFALEGLCLNWGVGGGESEPVLGV